MSDPTVGVLVTTYNGREDTLSCLRSLARNDYSPLRVLVMDDASTDGTEEAVRREFPAFRVHRNERNLRYVRNVNRGIEMLDGVDYVLLLNNDVTVSPDLVRSLVRVAESDRTIGMCGPRMFFSSRPDVLWAAGGVLSHWNGRTRHRALGERGDGDQVPKEVDYIPGAAVLIRAESLRRVGVFDPRFEAYFEEVDFCLRLRGAGYRVVHVPSTAIWHKVSATMGGRFRPKQKFLMARNRPWCLRRHLPGWARLRLFCGDLMTSAAEFSANLLVRDVRAASALFRGFCAGWGTA